MVFEKNSAIVSFHVLLSSLLALLCHVPPLRAAPRHRNTKLLRGQAYSGPERLYQSYARLATN